MNKFGKQLKFCRTKVEEKIYQRDLAEIIHKDPSVISKLESQNPKVFTEVAPLNFVELTAITKFFRDRNVPESEIENLKEIWKKEPGNGSRTTEFTDQLLISLQQLIGGFEHPESDAIREEISNIVYFWREYKRVTENFSSGKFEFWQAEAELNKLLDDSTFRGGARLTARLLLHRGIYRGYQGRVGKAETDFRDALSSLESIGGSDPIIQANLWIELGDLYRRQDAKNWKQAIEFYEAAGKILEPFRGEVVNSIIKRKISSVYSYAGQPREALNASNESLKISRKSSDREAERKALEHKAWALSFLGNLDEAIELQLEAHAIGVQQNVHPKELAKSYRYLGDYYSHVGRYNEALLNYESAKSEITKTRKGMVDTGTEKEKVLRGWLLLGIGYAMMQLGGKKVEAQKILGESLDISIDLEDTVAIGLCHLRLGELYVIDDTLEKASRQFGLAKEAFKASGLTSMYDSEFTNPYHMTNYYLGMAEIKYKSYNKQEALEHVDEAKKMAQENGYAVQEIEAYLKLAKFSISNSSIDIEEFFLLYDSAVKKASNSSILLLPNVLRKIHFQIRMMGKNKPEHSNDLANKLLAEWKDYLSLKSKEKIEYQYLEKWLKLVEEDISRWETLLSTRRN